MRMQHARLQSCLAVAASFTFSSHHRDCRVTITCTIMSKPSALQAGRSFCCKVDSRVEQRRSMLRTIRILVFVLAAKPASL